MPVYILLYIRLIESWHEIILDTLLFTKYGIIIDANIIYLPLIGEALNQYPEVLASMREELITALIDNCISDEIAQYAAYIAVEKIMKTWGGSQIYIPKGIKFNATERHKLIIKQFTGNNHKELCIKYGVTRQWLYKIIKRQRENFRNNLVVDE